MNTRIIPYLWLCLQLLAALPSPAQDSLWITLRRRGANNIPTRFDYYRNRYGIQDVYGKITGNRGEGYEGLYGTRNMRPVLHGLLYRGGANNTHLRQGRRENINPLPPVALENLCREGFSTAIYLYSQNFSRTSMPSFHDSLCPGFSYISNGFYGNAGVEALFGIIKNAAEHDSLGPIYLHCWNGWHQSGFFAALALRQFCGYTAEEAIDYWIKTADYTTTGLAYFSGRIRAFRPMENYRLNDSLSREICGCRKGTTVNDDSVLFTLNEMVQKNIVFRSGSYLPDTRSDTSLLAYLDFMRLYPFVKVSIQGHTDGLGDAGQNLRLSEQRAGYVYRFLVGKGIEKQRLSYRGYGSSMPLFSDDTPEHRSANRRIVFGVSSFALSPATDSAARALIPLLLQVQHLHPELEVVVGKRGNEAAARLQAAYEAQGIRTVLADP